MKQLIDKILLLLLVILMATACQTEEKNPNQFTVSGEITGLTGNLYFRHPDKEYTRETPSDSIVLTNGKFSFSDSISGLKMIRAYPNFKGLDQKLFKVPKDGRGYFPVKCAYLMFYAFPGAEITITGEATDYMNAYPSGDAFNESLAAANRLTFPKYNEMGNLAVQTTHETDSLIIRELNEKSGKIEEENINGLINHIENNQNSLAAVWYLNDLLLRSQIDDDQAIALFEKVSVELSEYADYKDVEARVEGIKVTKEGNPVPEIKTTATLDGSKFDINSLKGKYVLIDFWGIWCGPCVAEMPTVKEFQEKHKENLVVLGINSGDTKEKIQDFIDENGYDWLQLMSDRKNTTDNFVNRFNVQGFPTKFIIDPEGKILKRYMGSGEEAFELLEELLNE